VLRSGKLSGSFLPVEQTRGCWPLGNIRPLPTATVAVKTVASELFADLRLPQFGEIEKKKNLPGLRFGGEIVGGRSGIKYLRHRAPVGGHHYPAPRSSVVEETSFKDRNLLARGCMPAHKYCELLLPTGAPWQDPLAQLPRATRSSEFQF